MCKVVTGAQGGQLANPGPFTARAWRSRVYLTRSSLWLRCRPPGWVLRFVIRHSADAAGGIAAVLAWQVIGWLDLAALAASTAVALVVWCWRFPGAGPHRILG